MDNIEQHILKIKVQTTALKVKHIQELLKKIKEIGVNQKHDDIYKKYCSEILQILWHHLETGFKEFDDQLLCSTCFYTILTYSSDKEYYLNLILEVLDHELDLKEKGMISVNMSKTISLMYGIFQSSILELKSKDFILESILNKTFSLLVLQAYEYSQYTFITFKIMTFFKKVIGTDYEGIIFNRNCNFKLLDVVNHNWENPITGVRSLNKIIFKNLISVLDKVTRNFILQKLKGFYWNKAKYLMFSEIIENYQGSIKSLISDYNLVEGLTYSLHKAGLVSAGADMYITLVRKLCTEVEWFDIFISVIIEMINGISLKPIENFYNYWCLNTLKIFPSLTEIIFEEILKQNCAKYKLYSCLSLILQGNRLGLEKNLNYKNIEECVLVGVEHSDAHIRRLSFNIICCSQNTFLKAQIKYDLIMNFLKNNINSDCSVLRINMIDSLQKCIVKEHTLFVSMYNQNKDSNATRFQEFLTFCTALQKFIIESLNFNGNYQRKVATIQVIKVVFNTFKGVSSKRQRQSRQPDTILMDFLIKEHYWLLYEEQFVMKLVNLLKDPSDDIREHVIDLLLHNYSDLLCKKQFLDHLTEEALSCIKSRFFYQITCGQVMFKLVINLLLINKCTERQFKKVEDVFEFAYEVLRSECNSKVDIVKSINEGKQLHSYVSILQSIFEVCLEKSYELNISINVINSLLEILTNISNQFVWEPEEATVSSDFSKMNDMVQDMIIHSEHQICNQDDETKLSGLHQIVLNCMWLNVKASCQLSSILIAYYKDDSHTEVCNKCLKIICNVLETSRHKGAIEAGGAALGQAIQQLTSSAEGSEISEIPMVLLKSKLNELISEASNMASVTRRGAGLSIMIHRIVSSDMKKEKPLFHFFMQVLLETCNKVPGTTNNETEGGENDKDLPKAIYIHFLTRIVMDSSLASVMMYYSAKLAEIAFDNLASPCWQIRNAALQLYGSLIPKLIGQKKNSGTSDEVMATVAVDEFRTHSPKLWSYIAIQLEYTSKLSDALEIHNNLVPILSIFANMAPMYCFVYDKDINEALLLTFLSLLGSPIYVVRRLTAQCILNIYPFELITKLLLHSTCKTENHLHGTLILLNDFIKQYNEKKDLKEIYDVFKWKYYDILKGKNHSYLCKERFECIFPEFINLTDIMIKETLFEVCEYGKEYTQGIFLWANARIKKYLENATWCRVPEVVTIITDCSDFEVYCWTLCKRIENEKNIPEQILVELFNTLYLLGFKRKSTRIWQTLYEISLKTELISKQLDSSLLHRYLIDNELSYSTRYMLPFAARLFMNSAAEEMLLLSNIIFKLCNPEITDVDIRLIAAMANNELARQFASLSEYVKINSIKAAVISLQDEDEDVRNSSIHFYRHVNMVKTETQPYVCLQKILSNDFLNVVCGIPLYGIRSICIDLIDVIKSITMNNEVEYNPFASESKNIYLEPEVLKCKLSELNTV